MVETSLVRMQSHQVVQEGGDRSKPPKFRVADEPTTGTRLIKMDENKKAKGELKEI